MIVLQARPGLSDSEGEMQVGGDQLKMVPKPHDAEHPRARLLRHKSLIAWIDREPTAWLHSAEAKTEVVKAWKGLAPRNRWLRDYTSPCVRSGGQHRRGSRADATGRPR